MHVVRNIWLWKLSEEKVMWVGIIIEKEALSTIQRDFNPKVQKIQTIYPVAIERYINNQN